MSATLDIDHLRTWIGRSEQAGDEVTPQAVAGFRATLDLDPAPPSRGDRVPPGFHWCLAPPVVPMSAIGQDGHPARGSFVPPVPLPRRMWAGGRIRFPGPLRVGDEVTRLSTVKSVEAKHGRTGTLVFVVVEHVLSTGRGAAVVEEHDIVFRDAPAPGAGVAPEGAAGPAPPAEHSRTVEPSPVLLFRYSALTFNGHRIHYDRSYAVDVEGYPGLVVHGPLQATLLMGLAEETGGQPLSAFAFRAMRPLFDLAPFTIAAGPAPDGSSLRVLDADGRVTMTASAARAGG